MKDLNELMQAILAMDAAQRKAMADALADRKKKREDLPAQQEQIAKTFADAARVKAQAAAVEKQKASAEVLTALAQRGAAAEKQLEADVAEHRAAWAQQLADRALAR